MVPYYHTAFVDLYWDDELACVYTEWHGYHSDAEGQEVLEKGLDLLTQHHGHAWLGDQRHRAVFSLSFQQWSDEVWFPRAIARGLRRLAIVNAESAVTRMAARRLTTDLQRKGMEIAFFDNPEAARQWLRENAPTPDPPQATDHAPD
jgi:hypothetical protein